MKPKLCFAFFDVDDTLIRIKSMFDFYHFWCYEVLKRPQLHDAFEADFSRMLAENQSREELNRAYYRHFVGVEPQLLNSAGAEWATARLLRPDKFFVAPVVEELRRLQGRGVAAVFVSGSFYALLEPIARSLGVCHILATKLRVSMDGLYTGDIVPPQTIGTGKATAVQEFLRHHGASPDGCYAFGDDLSDLPMLNVVGYPVAVGTGTDLAKRAAAFHWPVIATSAVS